MVAIETQEKYDLGKFKYFSEILQNTCTSNNLQEMLNFQGFQSMHMCIMKVNNLIKP